MRLKYIDRTIQATLIVALLALVGGWLAHLTREGVSLFAGALWGSVNFYFLKHLMQHLLLQKEKKYFRIFILLCVKWPLLYFAGFGLLKIDYFSSVYLLIGFSILIGMIFIFGLREAFRVNEKRST